MKITAKLALSQLKINRSRTFWTLMAIALSTALTTAVCSFVASGRAMLVNFLGAKYGQYGHSYMLMMVIPGVIFGLIIAAMSIVVISNVFHISAQERVSQFGVLKCVGATKKQIIHTVIYESAFLSVVGIPIGILLGIVISFLGIKAADYFIEDLNALAHMMINEINLSLNFVLSWRSLLCAAAACFVTVLFSAWLPAHKAAKVSAIDCIRGAGEVKINEKNIHINPLVQKIWGFEGVLAAKNLKRNRKNFQATVISLSVGVMLFVSLGALSAQANAIQNFMTPRTDMTVISDYTSARYTRDNPDNGDVEHVYVKPLDSSIGDTVKEKLQEYGNIDIFGIGCDSERYRAIVTADEMSDVLPESEEFQKSGADYVLPVEIIVVDKENYSKLCKKAGVSEDSNILINHYVYNDFGHEAKIQLFPNSLKSVELSKDDGSIENVTIQGELTEKQLPNELIYPNVSPVRIVMPQAEIRYYDWYAKPSDVEGYMDYADKVMEEMFPEETGASYMESGFSTRVYKVDEYMKVMNIAISLASLFMYSFVVLLLLIGLTNVISTISTNVLMRAREFAVLKSVGMTSESLKKMLNCESILCTMKALLFGLPLGIIVSVLVNLPIRSMFPIPYKVPILAIVLSIAAVFLITLGTTQYASHKLKRQNIIEAIRNANGR